MFIYKISGLLKLLIKDIKMKYLTVLALTVFTAQIFSHSFLYDEKVWREHTEIKRKSIMSSYKKALDKLKYKPEKADDRFAGIYRKDSKSLNKTRAIPSPYNVQLEYEGIQGFRITWEYGWYTEGFIVTLGTEPGKEDIDRGFFYENDKRASWTYSYNDFKDKGINVGDLIYMNVEATIYPEYSDPVSVPVKIENTELGKEEYYLTLAYKGFSSTEEQEMRNFYSLMMPIIRKVYGPPSHTYTVTLVHKEEMSSVNVFYPHLNEIHMAKFNPRLTTHEILHAYHDNVVFAMGPEWHYNAELTGWEESFAEGGAFTCMNSFFKENPTHENASQHESYNAWNYDFQNISNITTKDYGSDGGDGMGLFRTRYAMGAAAAEKIILEDPDYLKKFNQEYYRRLYLDIDLTTSRDLMIDIMKTVKPTVEGHPAEKWVDMQRIYDCKTIEGYKVYPLTDQREYWNFYYYDQKVFYYKTFPNGSDYVWTDENDVKHWHEENGKPVTLILYDWNGNIIKNITKNTEPSEPLETVNRFAFARMNMTNAEGITTNGTTTSDWIYNLTDFGLYTMELNAENATQRFFRIIGNDLNPDGDKDFGGVYGGVIDSRTTDPVTGDALRLNGTLKFKHSKHTTTETIEVNNGAFISKVPWAGQPGYDEDLDENYYYTSYGPLEVTFITKEGKEYYDQRNCRSGNWAGSQCFLFNLQNMRTNDDISKENKQTETLLINYPNPFNPITTISYSVGMPLGEHGSPLQLSIYNINGQLVKTLVNKKQKPGNYSVTFDGSDLNSGIYYYKLTTPEQTLTNKMILVK